MRIKINSLRTPKNYLVPVTKKIIPNRYRPYTITATSNLDVNQAIANGKGGIVYTANSPTYAYIVITGAIKCFVKNSDNDDYTVDNNSSRNISNSAINPDNA